MNILRRKQRDLEIVAYLCTVRGEENGRIIHPTYEEASVKFDLAATHIAKIKMNMIGKDGPNGERILPKELS